MASPTAEDSGKIGASIEGNYDGDWVAAEFGRALLVASLATSSSDDDSSGEEDGGEAEDLYEEDWSQLARSPPSSPSSRTPQALAGSSRPALPIQVIRKLDVLLFSHVPLSSPTRSDFIRLKAKM